MTFIKIDMNLITKCNPRDKRKFPSFSSQVNNNIIIIIFIIVIIIRIKIMLQLLLLLLVLLMTCIFLRYLHTLFTYPLISLAKVKQNYVIFM